jgi:hypothetical protein
LKKPFSACAEIDNNTEKTKVQGIRRKKDNRDKAWGERIKVKGHEGKVKKWIF